MVSFSKKYSTKLIPTIRLVMMDKYINLGCLEKKPCVMTKRNICIWVKYQKNIFFFVLIGIHNISME
jgi:hypothetical protein